MKVLLIGRTTCYGTRRLQEECAVRGIEFAVMSPSRLVVDIRDGEVTIATKDGMNLLEYDVFYFRGIGKYANELSLLAHFLKQHQKLVVEDVLATASPYFDKLTAVLHDSTIPYIESKLVFSLSKEVLSKIMFPVIVKSLQGSQGGCVELVHTEETLKTICSSFGYPVLLQKYIPIAHDYRVVVVDGLALGVLKRYCTGDYFLTTRKGGDRESVELPQEILTSVVAWVKKAGIAIAGVDVLEHAGKYYCIEINMSPQFRVFEKITMANVAGAICDMLQKKYETLGK